MPGTFSDVSCWVAADNASAHLDSQTITTVGLTPSQWNEVLDANQRLAYGVDSAGHANPITYDYNRITLGTLLAPALAR